MGYMQEIVEDGTRSILFSTHITEDLDQIGDYILLMDYGRLILDLTREELADRYLLLHGTKRTTGAVRFSNGRFVKISVNIGIPH